MLTGKGAGQSSRDGCAPSRRQRAFSLIEMIGVLAVIAILAAVLMPAFIRQMDKVAGDQETAALKSFGDALQQSIMRSTPKTIPDATTWASAVATELGVDIAAVTNSPRRQPRFLLIDPNLSINGGGLPYTQSSAGSTNLPVSPRIMLLSSVGSSLPAGIASGIPSAENFNNIWNAPDGTIPAAPAFSGWDGSGADVKIHRLNLSPLFVPLLLSTHLSSEWPRYAIDPVNPTNAAAAIQITGNFKSYFIQNSVLALYTHAPELDSQQILIRDNSFVYEQNIWRGTGGFLVGGLDIAKVADMYLAAYPNVRARYGANQQVVVVSNMMVFMDRYSDWAGAGFPYPSSQHTALANAQAAMKNAVQEQYQHNSYNPNEVPCQ